jgi:hypothetical protein
VLSGCATQIRVIPSDRAVTRLPALKPFTPPIPGYFVPDALMLEILERGLTTTNKTTP